MQPIRAKRPTRILSCALALPLVGLLGAPFASETRAAEPAPQGQSATSGALTPTSPKRVASYDLSARLDESTHVVTGKGTIVWTNASREPASDLYFHLYLNAFKDDRTLFMRSPFTGSRSSKRLGRPGSVTVKRLTSARFGDEDLWRRAAKHSPGDPNDATDIRVPLPSPIEPGEEVAFEVEFTSELPEIVERTGFSGSFHLVAQWFPKLARREENGAWAHFPFHPHAEFYADFGDYDVTLDTPQGFVVGASGELTSSEEKGGRKISRYRASGVIDFAWTAWDGFEVEERTIEGVRVSLLLPRGAGPAGRVTWSALAFAFPELNARYGRYPYPTLTVVHPPRAAAAAGGMEYPTFITTGGSPLYSWLGLRLIEQVTVHELGHQWFQSMIATNEAAHPFLDEGLNSYAEWQTLDAMYGPSSILERFGLEVSIASVGRWGGLGFGQDEAIARPASAFTNMRALGGVVYTRTALALSTIGGVYGEAKLRRALSIYAARYRFEHPTPEQFLSVISDELGAGAAENLKKMLFERGFVDYSVRDLDSRSVGGTFKSRATITRHGTLALPVTVRFALSDGDFVEPSYGGEDATTVIEIEHGAPLVSVTVDPGRKVALDENRLNDTRLFRRTEDSLRVGERAVYLAELLLHWLAP